MAIDPLSTFPSPPLLGQTQSEFNTKASNTLSAMTTFVTELNTSFGQFNTDKTEINGWHSYIESVANNKGLWTNLAGALNIPASVSHTNSIWILNVNLANVALSEPTAINTDWTEVNGVTQAELDEKAPIASPTFTGTVSGINATMVGAEPADATIAKTGATNTFTLSQRGTLTTDNDGSFDMNVTNNFKCTPAGNFTLTFTNIAAQGGDILLVNTGGHTVSAAATTKVDSTLLATISAAGTYAISYMSDGTNVYVTGSQALA